MGFGHFEGYVISLIFVISNVISWNAYFTDLHRMDNNPQHEEEGSRMHKSFSQTLLQDHFRASQLQEHNLIEWTDGPFPALPPPSVNTTSVPRSS